MYSHPAEVLLKVFQSYLKLICHTVHHCELDFLKYIFYRAYLMDDLELIGMDYIWRLVLNSCEDIANKAIELLKDCFTNLGPRLQTSQVDIHDDFISSCFDRLRASYDTITLLGKASILTVVEFHS